MGEDDTTLTDEEIEALLDEEDEEEPAPARGEGGRVDLDRDTLRSVYNPVYESLENVLSTILNRDVTKEIDDLDILDQDSIRNRAQEIQGDLVLVEATLDGAVQGTARYVLPEDDGLRLADVMMGQEGEDPPEEFDEVYESAIVEMYNQVINTMANQINEITGESIEISAPESDVMGADEFADRLENEEYFWVSSRVTVENLMDESSFLEVQPVELAELLMASQQPDEPESEPEPKPEPQSQATGPSGQEPESEAQNQGAQTEVKSVNFPQFEATEAEAGEGNLNMLMDVPMEVAVELGRTKLQVKEILNLGQGSIIELERLAGEPVDLLVNGRLVARGEVVVIDESFGVRVTSIVSPMDRIK